MRLMKAAKFLLSILLVSAIIASGCIGNNDTPNDNVPVQTAPPGESIDVDTSAIEADLNNIDAEEAELAGDLSDADFDLGI